jgi:peptidoglycan hydrolase CwlO-like protein
MSLLQSIMAAVAAGVLINVISNVFSAYSASVRSKIQHEENKERLDENTQLTKEILADVKRINGTVQRHAQRLDDHHEEINRLRDQARKRSPGRD